MQPSRRAGSTDAGVTAEEGAAHWDRSRRTSGRPTRAQAGEQEEGNTEDGFVVGRHHPSLLSEPGVSPEPPRWTTPGRGSGFRRLGQMRPWAVRSSWRAIWKPRISASTRAPWKAMASASRTRSDASPLLLTPGLRQNQVQGITGVRRGESVPILLTPDSETSTPMRS